MQCARGAGNAVTAGARADRRRAGAAGSPEDIVGLPTICFGGQYEDPQLL
jgi:hypothetical protein